MNRPCISDTEIRTVQDGVFNDVREDGRTLLQRRPIEISIGALDTLIGFEEFNGSVVEVNLSGTIVMAAASPSVVEVCVEEAEKESDETSLPSQGCGQLYISIDAVPSVLNFYACAVSNNSTRHRRDFLSHLALTIQNVFGAEGVQAQEQGGVAEPKPVDADKFGEAGNGRGSEVEPCDEEGPSDAPVQTATVEKNTNGSRNLNCGFPAKDLYIGKGYAFRIDVDVHVLQAAGGNLLSAIVVAVHSVLRKIKLPYVNLYQVTSSQVTVELDHSKPYGRPVNWMSLPLLAVLLLSPTRHYVVDPLPREELAIPQQLHVAANRDGQLCYMQYQQYPSRRGNPYMLASSSAANTDTYSATSEKASPDAGNSKKRSREGEEDISAVHQNGISNYSQNLFGVHLPDCMAAIEDAVHVCQAMIAECDAALETTAAPE
ncbi:unnamed protein product [Phytomonas sp. Hart1]|nr:unnamed protein product [Phytomonas sp. Hart1]|eukprot:CCW66383.1 unnamed protein product [Phytomonas sp. isolate Hart1]